MVWTCYIAMESQDYRRMSSSSQPTPSSEDPTNTPGSDAFINLMGSMVNREDVTEVIATQKHMLNRFEKTNEMLRSFNKLSSNHYDEKIEQFKNHTRTLLDMKRDLEIIFKRIKTLKTHVAKQYPDAVEAVEKDLASLEGADQSEGKEL